jgi:hypothetical protein
MNEFQAHESSYDHSHRMVRQLTTTTTTIITPTFNHPQAITTTTSTNIPR